MDSEKRIAAATPIVLRLVGWVSIFGLLIAVVGGIVGVATSYRFGSFIFSAGLFMIYAIATPARREDDAEAKAPPKSGGKGKK